MQAWIGRGVPSLWIHVWAWNVTFQIRSATSCNVSRWTDFDCWIFTCIQHFNQYIARNWPWYSLRGCISGSLGFLICYHYSFVFLIWYPYALVSLYGNTAHCFGCGVAMGSFNFSIFPKNAIEMSQWYDRYCFAEYARRWARHPTTPWQLECTPITDFQSIDSL